MVAAGARRVLLGAGGSLTEEQAAAILPGTGQASENRLERWFSKRLLLSTERTTLLRSFSGVVGPVRP